MNNTNSPEPQSNKTIGQTSSTGSTDTKNSQKGSSRAWNYLFCFFLGILLSFTFNLTLFKQNNTNVLVIEVQGLPNALSQEIRQILVIIVSGAFGGLLYSLQSRKTELPHVAVENQSTDIDLDHMQKRRVVYLGVVADCLIGIGGALIVFLLLPIDIGKENIPIPLIKLLATATIGGYGGRSLLDQALDTIIKKQEALQEKVDQTKQELDSAKAQAEKDAEALRLLGLYLDTSLTLTAEKEAQLIADIKVASRVARTQIFELAQASLNKNRNLTKEDIDRNSLKKLAVENARKLFQALQESDQNHDNHRYPAHVGYAYMALEKWSEAIEKLEEAKIILDRTNSDKDNKDYQQNRIVYESWLTDKTQELKL